MASAIHRDPAAGERLTNVVAQQDLVAEQMRRVGLSQRQVELNQLYSYARAQQHETCCIDWDGSPHPTAVDRQAIVSSNFLPQGYKDPGGNLDPLPLRYRRPSVPCHLGKVIPSRFTALLFGEGTHPQWKAPGSPNTEAWVEAVSENYALWSKMTLIRDLGGAMGTAIVGFKIIAGEVVFEEFDARWAFPTFDPQRPGLPDIVTTQGGHGMRRVRRFRGRFRVDVKEPAFFFEVIPGHSRGDLRTRFSGHMMEHPAMPRTDDIAFRVDAAFSQRPVGMQAFT